MNDLRKTPRDAEENGSESVPGGAAEAEGSGKESRLSPALKRISILGACGAIAIAALGLLGYIPGLGFLGRVHESFIPMAPSTAVSFILLGGILLDITRRSLPDRRLLPFGVLAALVTLFGSLEVVGHFTGLDLNFEDTIVPSAGHLGEIPIARMSPSTGAGFFLAGLAVVALLLQRRMRGRRRYLARCAGGLGGAVLVTGLVSCGAYLYGSPLLYGHGATVPMALTTALAFLMLGAGAMGEAGGAAVPVRLFRRTSRVAGRPISTRRRFFLLACIMVGVSSTTMAIMTIRLYRHEFVEREEQLRATVQSQARLIEAVARHDATVAEAILGENPDYDPFAATLSQIAEANRRYEHASPTTEFTLARREGDRIVFLLRHRHGDSALPDPVSFLSDRAEPQRRALRRETGTLVGLDYRGEPVLAAYDWVDGLDVGIVAKVDRAEIRAPFMWAAFTGGAIAALCIVIGALAFFWVSNPVIGRLEEYADELEAEVEQRRQAEEALAESERVHRSAIEAASAIPYYKSHATGVFEFVGRGIQELTGYAAGEITKEIFDAVFSEARPSGPLKGRTVEEATAMVAGDQDALWHSEIRLLTRTGEQKWVSDSAKGVYDDQGKLVGAFGILQDITQRVEAEEERTRLNAELAAKNEELEQVVYVASHDLRSPLVNIDGYSRELELGIEGLRGALDGAPATGPLREASLLLERDLPSCLRFIRTSAAKMDALLTGLLMLSRSGRATLTIDSLDMNELISKVIDSVDFAVRETGADLEIAELPPCRGDAVQVNQVFSNLLGNALKYLDPNRPGVIRVNGRIEGERSVYCVEDNGIGIDPAHQGKVFDIFHRLDPAYGQGEGLGLTIVKRVLDRLEGEIRLESDAGSGSRFYVALPALPMQGEVGPKEASR